MLKIYYLIVNVMKVFIYKVNMYVFLVNILVHHVHLTQFVRVIFKINILKF